MTIRTMKVKSLPLLQSVLIFSPTLTNNLYQICYNELFEEISIKCDTTASYLLFTGMNKLF